MALRAVPDHPKFADLRQRSGLPTYAVLGCLESIWHFCGRFTPRGNIGKYTDTAIEAWIGWEGSPGAAIKALVDSGWLDQDQEWRLLVHDWAQHADKATKQAVIRSKAPFCVPSIRPTREQVDEVDLGVHTVGTYSDQLDSDSVRLIPLPVPVPGPVPVPEPEPEPEPEPHFAMKRRPNRPDLNGQTSSRFDEWWAMWVRIRGNPYQDEACQAWLSVVTSAVERAALECTATYLAGPGADPGSGYRPDNFLFTNSKNSFASRYMPRKQAETRTGTDPNSLDGYQELK